MELLSCYRIFTFSRPELAYRDSLFLVYYLDTLDDYDPDTTGRVLNILGLVYIPVFLADRFVQAAKLNSGKLCRLIFFLCYYSPDNRA